MASNHDQKQYFNEASEKCGDTNMLPYFYYAWQHDPKHIIFALARYKFVAKMLRGKLLEAGCGDGYAIPVVLENADTVEGVDVADAAIKNGQSYFEGEPRINLRTLNIIEKVDEDLIHSFDGAYSIDVIEHIAQEEEDAFVGNIAKTLKPNAPLIIGTPNITASQYASKASEEQHINLFDHDRLRLLLEKYFHNVFMFSMNDEVLHTGFNAMGHYIMALAVGPK